MKLKILLLSLSIFTLCGFRSLNEQIYTLIEKGNKLAESGKSSLAIAEYEKALKLDERASEIHQNIGVLYYKDKKYSEAIKSFKKLEDNDFAKFYEGNSYFNIAKLEEKPEEQIKNYKLALDSYKGAIILNSTIEEYKKNYEIVKKIVDKMEQSQEQKQDKNKEQEKDKEKEKKKEKNKKDNKNQDESKDKQNEKDTKQENQENKKNESSENKKDEEKKDENKKENSSEDKKESSKEQNEEDKKNKEQSVSENKEEKKELTQKEMEAMQILKGLERDETDNLKNNQRVRRSNANGIDKEW